MRDRRMMNGIAALLLATVVVFVGGCTEYPHTQTSAPEPAKMAEFPWPPPPASAETEIPSNWLLTRTGATKLGQVAKKLENALEAAQYQRRWSYLSVPRGFALVTRMEQIKADGTPSSEPARWSTALPPWGGNTTLLEFVKALVNAPAGYYRVLAFIVTDRGWARAGEPPTKEDTEVWFKEGETILPPEIGELTYGQNYRTTVLVYEFKKVSKESDATFLDPSLTSADDHLENSGISKPLSRP